MKIEIRERPKEVGQDIDDRIVNDLQAALNSVQTEEGKFIINDTVWFQMTVKGKIMPTVVNSATFISSKFQTTLREREWMIGKKEIRNKLLDQEIDGYIELATENCSQITLHNFRTFINKYWDDNPGEGLDKGFNYFYPRFCRRACFHIDHLEKKYHTFFDHVSDQVKIRIGLEFETGNIASSFRAFAKLAFLYQANFIDAAVFITSENKTSARKIWPLSNRNGSFEELEKRKYRDNIPCPLWEFSLAPDAVSKQAGYLGSDGTMYFPKKTGKNSTVQGKLYEIFTDQDGRQILLRTES